MFQIFETKQADWLTRDGHFKPNVELVAVSLKEPYHAGWMLAQNAAELLDAHNKGHEVELIVYNHENQPTTLKGIITGHEGIGTDGSERIELELTPSTQEAEIVGS